MVKSVDEQAQRPRSRTRLGASIPRLHRDWKEPSVNVVSWLASTTGGSKDADSNEAVAV